MLGQLLCEHLATPVRTSSLTVSLGGAREIDKIAPPDRGELECGPFGSTQARRASSDWTTPRAGLGERAERRAGSCSCHESGGMGWCAGRDGDQAAPPSLGPFLCNRRGDFVCVRRPRKSPRAEATPTSRLRPITHRIVETKALTKSKRRGRAKGAESQRIGKRRTPALCTRCSFKWSWEMG